MSFLTDTCVTLDDPNSARHLYRLLTPYASYAAADYPEGFRGPVFQYLGALATSLGNWQDAREHFENAIAMNEQMNTRPWLARAQESFAHMLRLQGTNDDQETVAALESAARATKDELGLA
ncbi:MAG TPA: hypothetical protein VI259_04515, partial [Gemmatimonadaceae bacterium]